MVEKSLRRASAVDSGVAPLHQGTVARIYENSLSGIANRYIVLEPGRFVRAYLEGVRRDIQVGRQLPERLAVQMRDRDAVDGVGRRIGRGGGERHRPVIACVVAPGLVRRMRGRLRLVAGCAHVQKFW